MKFPIFRINNIGTSISGFLTPGDVTFPWVADGAVGLNLGRLAENLLNKHRGQPTRSGPVAWGFGVRLTTSYYKIIFVQKYLAGTGLT